MDAPIAPIRLNKRYNPSIRILRSSKSGYLVIFLARLIICMIPLRPAMDRMSFHSIWSPGDESGETPEGARQGPGPTRRGRQGREDRRGEAPRRRDLPVALLLR